MSKKYAVLGSDVSKSLSPKMHEKNFLSNKDDAIYKSISINNIDNIFMYLKKLDGFNVTTPFKKEIIKYLDSINEEAKITNSVNTVIKENGKLIGYNTDGLGFLEALCDVIKFEEIKDKKIILFGAGGAARSIFNILNKYNKNIMVANRTIDNINFSDNALTIDRALSLINKYDLIINATTIDLEVNEKFNEKQIIFDIRTISNNKFLKEAEKKGAKCINGLSMLINQGALAYKIWFKKEADKKAMYSGCIDASLENING